MHSESVVNDFVVKFANVNGSGSASANHLFAKAVFRSGVPVSPRNIFPSNIQGLPTWYEVRVSEKGYTGRRGGADIVVAMNAQTFFDDVNEVESGGYLIYDSTKPTDVGVLRDDVTFLGIPLMDICLHEFGNITQRHLFKNIVYVGALCALLNMELGIFKNLIKEQFKGKEKLVKPNEKALDIGFQYAHDQLGGPIDFRVERRDLLSNKILMEGNDALGLGAVYGGATVVGWYPITPSTSVVEAFSKYADQFRVDEGTGEQLFSIVQAEDELSAIGMAIGANWSGARAFTATSGPGISLMSEFLGLAYFAEIPLVLFNIQRGGPSTGLPTRTQQSDVVSCAFASHGDTKQILLFPSSPTECFEFSAQSFDLADRLQTPVIVLSDLDLGMNDWCCDELQWDDSREFDRGKVLDAAGLDAVENWGRYRDVDSDGICYRTYPGAHSSKGAYFTRGTSHDSDARYTESGAAYVENVERLLRKYETSKKYIPKPIIDYTEGKKTSYGIIYYGSTEPALRESLDELLEGDLPLNALRIRSFPLHAEVYEFIEQHKTIFVVEQNRDAQMRQLIISQQNVDMSKLVPILHFDGTPITERFISNAIKDYLDPKVMPFSLGQGKRAI
ncbi:MAG: 2-oxoacid:acceptor oxidoreductase subunit alpha [Pseudomonadales bacterium]|nr:2-oxoacid:acceptor oxidoreductase subunit alpha [Pseudomonadales bacterium]